MYWDALLVIINYVLFFIAGWRQHQTIAILDKTIAAYDEEIASLTETVVAVNNEIITLYGQGLHEPPTSHPDFYRLEATLTSKSSLEDDEWSNADDGCMANLSASTVYDGSV